MSVAELRELEEVKGLIARGLQVGVLTYGEIAVATAELDLDETDVEGLHGFLERAEIELVEELEELGNAEKVRIGGIVQLAVRVKPMQKKRTGRNPATGGGDHDRRQAGER